jgi:hypothetical protein
VLILRDEPLLFRVRSRDVKRHRLARLRDSMGCLHAECSHEDSPTLTSSNTPNEVVRCTTPRTGTNSARGSCANVSAGSIGELIVDGRDFPNREFPLRRDCPARGVHRNALGGVTMRRTGRMRCLRARSDESAVNARLLRPSTPKWRGPTSRAEFRRGR